MTLDRTGSSERACGEGALVPPPERPSSSPKPWGVVPVSDKRRLQPRSWEPLPVRERPFTALQLRTLELLAEGFMAKEVAWRTGCSESALKQRLGTIARRLGSSRTLHGMVAVALREGIIL